MLIKLLELYEEISHAEKAENFKKKHLMREIVVNTDFIVTLRTDNAIEKYIKDNPASYEGLKSNDKFTRVSLNKGTNSSEILVVGSLDQILKLLDISNKGLIKG